MRFILSLYVVLSYSISTVLAEESRQVDKHEHGVGELNIAIDGSLAEFEFMLPGADIVGFEYEAKSDEDLAKIENALLVLENYENLFALTKNSKCVLADLDYHLSGEEHDEHADEEHADEEHADEEHADEEHEEHADEESHTEFYAKYSFKCDNIKQLDKVEFSYFKTFPNSSELEVQFVSDIGSNAFEVEADKPVIILKGLL
ncbi:MAG: ZrgA family zinc uptake protein [Candidatus Pelagibacterales bacterium]